MIFFTPDIGTLLKLEQDWTFTLFSEYRNRDLFNKLKQLGKISSTDKNQVVDLPKGLVVKVDRVYIRKGLSQYSSITFTIPKPKNKAEKEEMPLNLDYTGSKFWVKLHECNGIEFSPLIGNKETFESFQKIYQENYDLKVKLKTANDRIESWKKAYDEAMAYAKKLLS